MSGKTWHVGAMALAAVGLSGAAPSVPAPGGEAATIPAAAAKYVLATSKDLGGADRFLSYLSTDKPIYRANEKVYARAVVLNAATHVALGNDAAAMAEIQIVGPRGETVATGSSQVEDGTVGYAWTVPEGAAGGEYTLKVKYPYAGYAPAERKFDVRIYRAPRLKSQVTFAREGYGPGEKVTASVHSERAEGGFPAGAKVTVTARVDDRQVWTGPATIDAKGDATASFELPKAMERGEGTLAFAIEDGGVVETASKTIPILLQTLDLEIYPEGGDAVAGMDNRFYFEAKTPAKKPADLVGAVYDSKGKKVAEVKSEHEGRGRFDFTPAAGEMYTLKVSEPVGISKTWTLPAAKASGVVIHTTSDIVAHDKPVAFTFTPAVDLMKSKVTLTKREMDASGGMTMVASGQSAACSITPKDGADGVLTLTVWNDKGEPIAERLVYRQPAHEVKVNVKADQSTYTPGGKVKLEINTTDEMGKAISAVVGLTVTDDSIQEMIEKREHAPRLPVMVMLEPEVKELADAQIYLDASNPKAALATDLLLGTQGWRRFAVLNATEFMAKYGDDAKRVLAFVKPEPPQVMAFNMRGGGGGAVPRAMLLRAGAAAPEMAMAANGPADEIGVEDGAAVDRGLADKDIAANKGVAPAGPAKDAEMGQRKMMAPMAPPIPGGGRAGIAAGQMRMQFVPGGGDFVVVREYAHELRPNWSPSERSDFAETVYWNAGIKTDQNGHATAAFALSDSVTTYRVFADAFGKIGETGAVGGSSAGTVQAVQPFFIEPKMPLEVTAGDVIQLPIAIRNNTAGALDNLKIAVTGGDLKIGALTATVPGERLDAAASVRKLYGIAAGEKPGEFDVTIDASAGAFSDHVTRKLRVKAKGFPTQLAFGGLVDAKTPAKKEFVVPDSLVASSMKTFITVYPSPMANLTDAVAALLQEPGGCFEQTSSTAYPLAMAQGYFMSHQGVDPALAAKGAELLTHGYQKLIAFECKDRGYEWFGGAVPGHEALTAYGLMEFSDMKKAGLAAVDDQMVDRTRTWLISRENKDGGFERNAKSLDSFGGAPELTTDAYIVWALLQAGEKPETLAKQIAFVRDAAEKSEDSYVLALAANISQAAKSLDDTTKTPLNANWAGTFMQKLAKKQNKEGGVEGGLTSITRSGGEALAIETTALASLAWQKDRAFAGNAQSAIKFLADSCKGGRFGSTQSTILALKAIVAYDTANAHPKAAGNLTLFIDDSPWGGPVGFTAESTGTLAFGDFASKLPPGPHTVEVRMADGSEMPYSMGVEFNSITPASDKQCKLDLLTRLKDGQLAEGGITEARVVVSNRSDKDAATPVAIVGIPGGLEVRHDQLKELVKAGKIDAYEVRGREVVLYWRQIKAGAKCDVSLSLTAAIPGMYTAPASRVYEYYTDEFKQWVEGTTVVITAK